MGPIVLNATTKKITAVLGAAVATTQPDYTCYYADVTSTTFTEGSSDGTLNSTTAVDIVAAPAASTIRIVKEIIIHNCDTASIDLTIKLDNNGTGRKIDVQTITTGQSWALSEIHSIGTTDTELNILIDTTTTADTVYIGKAVIGTPTSADEWQIKKIDTSVISITYADSDANFDNVWDDRASLSYG